MIPARRAVRRILFTFLSYELLVWYEQRLYNGSDASMSHCIMQRSQGDLCIVMLWLCLPEYNLWRFASSTADDGCAKAQVGVCVCVCVFVLFLCFFFILVCICVEIMCVFVCFFYIHRCVYASRLGVWECVCVCVCVWKCACMCVHRWGTVNTESFSFSLSPLAPLYPSFYRSLLLSVFLRVSIALPSRMLFLFTYPSIVASPAPSTPE